MMFTLFPDMDDTDEGTDNPSPATYRGLHAFHKYWGKKPPEPIRSAIRRVCPRHGLVLDPFLGSGVTLREAIHLDRRCIGMDLNPIAVRIASFLASPPSPTVVREGFAIVTAIARDAILSSYRTRDGLPASHYVWNHGDLECVWIRPSRSHRVDRAPDADDVALAAQFADYQPQRLAPLRCCANARLGATPTLAWRDVFTGRALRNIDILLSAIDRAPKDAREALLLTVTAALGQMSSMVVLVRHRSSREQRDLRESVGAWMIGYWRPRRHLESNVWNCFERRVRSLLAALSQARASHTHARAGTVEDVCDGTATYAILCDDALQRMEQLPAACVHAIITDPPHADRIPYLEASAWWNAVLGEHPSFEREIVVSNAHDRGKTWDAFHNDMIRFLAAAERVLRPDGCLIIFFNARERQGWRWLERFMSESSRWSLSYRGCYPLEYSQPSIAQRSRIGALHHDYGLVFARDGRSWERLSTLPGWMHTLPIPDCSSIGSINQQDHDRITLNDESCDLPLPQADNIPRHAAT